jgi:hypothetical protein
MNYTCYQTVIGLALIVYGRWTGRLIKRVRVTERRARRSRPTSGNTKFTCNWNLG